MNVYIFCKTFATRTSDSAVQENLLKRCRFTTQVFHACKVFGI